MLLYYLCGSFIIAPSVVLFLITILSISRDCCRCSFGRIHFKLGLGLMIAIGGPFGIPLFVYAFILAINDSNEGDFYIIEGLSRATSLVEALFESLPQICIQFYNNQYYGNWQPLRICSVSVSAIAIAYTCYKLCHAIDKIHQYEKSATELKTAHFDSKTISDRRIEAELELEVYDVSDDNHA